MRRVPPDENERALKKSYGRRRLRVLVVDDNRVHRQLLHEVLTELDANVHLASNGEEAVEFGGVIDFDLILMDLAMQGTSGEVATSALRARGVQCLIIAVTAHVPPRYRGEFPRHGFDGLIEKPFSARTIASTLQIAGAFAESGGDRSTVRALRLGVSGDDAIVVR
jgi:CheY-like chemotaxis protein